MYVVPEEQVIGRRMPGLRYPVQDHRCSQLQPLERTLGQDDDAAVPVTLLLERTMPPLEMAFVVGE
jgi:hypothetical protein